MSCSSLVIYSYNCRGFNSSKSSYISSLMSGFSILFLQEHWLAEAQLGTLCNISANVAFTGTSGFDNDEVLLGRPYGGCAILWNSLLLANVCPLVINCRRVCAIRASFDTYKVLFINVLHFKICC